MTTTPHNPLRRLAAPRGELRPSWRPLRGSLCAARAWRRCALLSIVAVLFSALTLRPFAMVAWVLFAPVAAMLIYEADRTRRGALVGLLAAAAMARGLYEPLLLLIAAAGALAVALTAVLTTAPATMDAAPTWRNLIGAVTAGALWLTATGASVAAALHLVLPR